MEDGRRDWQSAAESAHTEARVQGRTAQADNGRGTTSQGGEAETAHARGREQTQGGTKESSHRRTELTYVLQYYLSPQCHTAQTDDSYYPRAYTYQGAFANWPVPQGEG